VAEDRPIDHRAALHRAALDAHDHQKDWPEELWSVLVDGLRPHLRLPCLEVGVGAGLVAVRLASPGAPVIGLDFNRSMLGRLRERAPDCPAVHADARMLPIAPRAVGSIVISNVLHLLADWRVVLREVAAAARTDGRILINLGSGGRAPSAATEVRRWFLAAIPAVGDGYGPSAEGELDEALLALGFDRVAVVTATGSTHRTVRDVVARLEHNPFAWPEGMSRTLLAQTAADIRARALDRFGTIDEPLEHHVQVRFRVYGRDRAR